MTDTAPSNTPEYSVSEIANALKRTVEDRFGQVRVRGELSGFKRHASGHWYGCMKDERAVIDLVMFKASAASLAFRPEDGFEVIATGKLTTYPGRSKYQIVVERMEPAGAGALLAQIEARRLKLAAEGLFDAARKKPLPYIPAVIGVVTSPTGAVIRDILHRLADRFPRHVIIWPVAVQGEASAAQVTAAIRGFNAIAPDGKVPRPDLLIVARGGGSIEDLAAFNEESVVRAVAESVIPVISAVGHETDTTLVDFASDWRAPTPTAAAERAVPVLADLRLALGSQALRLDRAATRGLAQRRERAEAIGSRLPQALRLTESPAQRLDDLSGRLPRALIATAGRWRGRLAQAGAALRPALVRGRRDASARALQTVTAELDRARRMMTAGHAQRLDAASRLLGSLGPEQVLNRGYAIISSPSGGLVTRAETARTEPRLSVRFADGDVAVTTGATVQGSLF